MRYTLCLLLFLPFITSATAQLMVGDRLFSVQKPTFGNLIIDDQSTNSNLFTALTSDELSDGLLVSGGFQYGAVVAEKLIVGTGLGVTTLFTDDGGSLFSIAPYGRYYFKNTSSLMLYGGFQILASFGDDDLFDKGVSFIPQFGASLAVAPNLLFSPELNYVISDNPNPIVLELQFEFILGRNNEVKKAVSDFAKGSVLLNAQAGSFSFGGDRVATRINFKPGLHYFLGNQFAVGAQLGIEHFSFDNGFFELDNTQFQFEANARYYLVTNWHFTPFVQAGGVLFDFGEGDDNSDIGFDIALGSNLWLRQNLALEFGLSYRAFPDFDISTISANIGAAFVLGEGE